MKKITYIKFAMLLFPVILFSTCNKTNDTISQYHLNVTSISPDSGGVNTLVTIKGNNFSLILSEDTVLFNGKIASINKASDTSLQVYAPFGGTTGKVTVIVRDQQVKTQTFTYLSFAPVISSINPASGTTGTLVTIKGSNFVADTSKNIVLFNGVKAAVASASTTQIVVRAPNSSTGVVKVTTNGLTTTGPVFTFTVPVPVITDVEYNGLFFIAGKNFDPTSSVVHIGGQLVSGFTYSDYGNGQGALTKSSYTPPSNLDNPVQVIVTVSNVSSSPYTYLFYPQIKSVSPDTVSYSEVVTLQGILFGSRSVPSSVKAYYNGGNNNKVYMSPNPTIISWSTNTITFNMPDYGVYPIGNGAQPFYFEVTVSTKSGAASVYFHIL